MSQKQHTTITRETTPNILATSPPRRVWEGGANDVAGNVATTFSDAASAGFDSNAKVLPSVEARHSEVLTCYESILLLLLLFVGCV